MKEYIKLNFFLGVMLIVSGLFLTQGCNDDDNYPMPVINNVRPTAVDSTITEGNFGDWISIQGTGFTTTTEVWFNSVSATFNPTFITDNNIVISIPSDFPEEITNKIQVVTKGGTAVFDFTVVVPPPVIASISNEFAKADETVIIKGDLFYNVSAVTFPGGAEAEILDYEPTWIQVVVPGSVSTGKISVSAAAGTTESFFSIHDRTGMICDYDALDKFQSWGKETVIVKASDNPTDPVVVDGNYIKMQSSTPVPKDNWWVDQTATPHDGIVWPDFPASDPAANYALKFEYYSVGVFNEGHIQMQFAWGPDYRFEPYKGMAGEDFVSTQWQTGVVPLNQFAGVSSYGDLKGKGFLLFLLRTPGATEPIVGFDMNFDNLRIVKIK